MDIEGQTRLLKTSRVCFEKKNGCRKSVYFVTIFTFSRVSQSNLQIVGEFFSKNYSDSLENALYSLN